MSTIKSSDEHLTINADGSGKDIKFQANGVEKASIDSSGNLTVSGNLTSVGIDDNADATAITIDSSENVGIGVTPKTWDSRKALQIGGNGTLAGSASAGAGGYLQLLQNAYTDGTWKYISTDEAARLRSQDGEWNFDVATSGSADSAISWTNALTITNDGRGLSSFTARCWIRMDGTGTISIDDSHNVSSIGDYGTGEYTINFANNMSNTTYPIFANGRENNKSVQPVFGGVTTSSFRVKSFDADTATVEDQDRISAIVFGD